MKSRFSLRFIFIFCKSIREYSLKRTCGKYKICYSVRLQFNEEKFILIIHLRKMWRILQTLQFQFESLGFRGERWIQLYVEWECVQPPSTVLYATRQCFECCRSSSLIDRYNAAWIRLADWEFAVAIASNERRVFVLRVNLIWALLRSALATL